MKTFDERRQSVQNHMQKIQKRRRRTVAAVTSLCLVLAILGAVLFVPYNTTPPDVSMYAGSDYYNLIQRLNDATFQKPAYKNNFEKLAANLDFGTKTGAAPGDLGWIEEGVYDAGGVAAIPNGMPNYGLYPDAVPAGTMANAADPENGDQYVEVTDNQVSGVIEADIFKRSDKYAFYLRDTELSVYSIAGEDSRLVGRYQVGGNDYEEEIDEWGKLSYFTSAEMYLSQDCKTVIILVSGYSDELGTCTTLISLDVSDPAKISEKNRVYFTGSYVSSRLVDGQILLTYNYKVQAEKIDFEDPATFVPQYGTPESMTCIPGDQIVCPENISDTRYTVVCKISGDSLEVEGSAALLSYSQELYVSEDTIYATHSYSERIDTSEEKKWKQTTMTEITGISYAGDSLEILGTISLEGSLKDQYSMDQYDGILRVVTSTSARTYQESTFGENVYVSSSGLIKNVNLYCVDLATWEIAASVIAFAPDGEDAQSVRFDGYNAYVCTAEVITLTDPVYFFDLSDLNNITWKDTGTIDGYSTSLINLGDGYLLGIGYNEFRQLKIEVYEETADGVISVCAYEREAIFSEKYKSYLVDRENNLIGLHVADSDGTGNRPYLLLHFDGYNLNEVKCISFDDISWMVPSTAALSLTRAFIADGYLYVFTENDHGFIVEKIA